MDKQDHFRFIHDLYEFNDKERVGSTHFKFQEYIARDTNHIESKQRPERELLVDILAFCLMPNHYHVLLTPKVEKGIPLFMQKLNMGYSQYFNKKYERSGTLFQGRYKCIPVVDETHYLHLPFYIHFNPLDLSYPEWRENKISSHKLALEFLKSYRWSSHLDYLGIRNFSSILNMELLTDIFDGKDGYKKLTTSYLKEIQIDKEVILE